MPSSENAFHILDYERASEVIERGKLQNLIFDNQVLWSHLALAAVLGVIRKLPPIKQVLAIKQVKSIYFEKCIEIMDI